MAKVCFKHSVLNTLPWKSIYTLICSINFVANLLRLQSFRSGWSLVQRPPHHFSALLELLNEDNFEPNLNLLSSGMRTFGFSACSEWEMLRSWTACMQQKHPPSLLSAPQPPHLPLTGYEMSQSTIKLVEGDHSSQWWREMNPHCP